MALPHSHTSDIDTYNLVTHGDHQFAVWYSRAGELRVGRIERGVQRWGVDHDWVELSGAIRTELALPVSDDTHNFPSIAISATGHLHVWANMHRNNMRYVSTTASHLTDGWLSMAGWQATAMPGEGVTNTYPTPTQLANGEVLFYMRSGSANDASGRGNSKFWWLGTDNTWSSPITIFQGISVPGAGPGGTVGSDESVDDATNWNGYPTQPVVEGVRGAHPGRVHMSWVWRRYIHTAAMEADPTVQPGPGETVDPNGERTQDYPSYGYSDDGGHTWYSIRGTEAVLPFTPLNNLDFRLGIQKPGGGGYGNWGTLTVDHLGFPHLLISYAPSYHVQYDWLFTGTWQQAAIPSSQGGVNRQTRQAAFWQRGQLWAVQTGGSSSFRQWYPRVWKLTGSDLTSFRIGGEVNAFGEWEPQYDPEAYRRFRTIEVLTPDGDIPRVATFGRNSRVRAAA